MGLGQIVAIIMVNKCMKFHDICFSTKVIAKVKVCHNEDDNNDYAVAAAADTRVMTIPALFFFEKQPSKTTLDAIQEMP